ncbi:hypothetical protein ACEXQE_11910 [Herbiconiux sp. P17]
MRSVAWGVVVVLFDESGEVYAFGASLVALFIVTCAVGIAAARRR